MDGVQSITLMALFRNNRSYIEWLIPKLESMEKYYSKNHGVQLHYAFYENDSTDTTPRLLQGFTNHPSRRGRSLCITDRLKEAPKSVAFENDTGIERTRYLGGLRNKLLAAMRPIKTQWVWMLDSDVYFEIDVLEAMFKCKPLDNNIAVMTSNTKEVKKKASPDGHPYICWEHYYDTYALVDVDDRMFYPLCRFKECIACKDRREKCGLSTYDSNSVIDVRSAYAGCAIMRGKHLDNPIVQWKTTEVCFGEIAMCEHVYFCDMMHIASDGGRVVIVDDVKLYWRK